VKMTRKENIWHQICIRSCETIDNERERERDRKGDEQKRANVNCGKSSISNNTKIQFKQVW
jgi:hypothetical protein